MPNLSVGYAIRVAAPASFNTISELVVAVASRGAAIAALEVVESAYKKVAVDITRHTSGDEHVSRSPLALINSLDRVDQTMAGRVVHLLTRSTPRKALSGCLSNLPTPGRSSAPRRSSPQRH